LRDGARAIRAFCRPYPVRVVGTPADIQFNIGKASLKVKIRVTPADAPQTRRIEEEGDGMSKGREGESMLPTEIFIPLVHFASDECVERSIAVRDPDPEDSEARSGSSATLPVTTSKSLAVGKGEMIETDGYALQVKVSEGRVEMDESEQMLRWFYDVPVSGEKEVTIEVVRVGGAIDWTRFTPKAKRGRVRWVERLCGEGCLVM